MSDITCRKFLKQSNKLKVSPAVFLQTHRDFLTAGNLGKLTSPILKRLDDKEILPSPCLEAIQNTVLGYMLAEEQAKAEKIMLKSNQTKQYSAMILDGQGNIVTKINEEGEEVELEKDSDDGAALNRWISLRLVHDSPVDAYGVLINRKMFDRDGKEYKFIMTRTQAMNIVFPPKKMQAMKNMSKKSSPLTQKMKVRGDYFHFSRG